MEYCFSLERFFLPTSRTDPSQPDDVSNINLNRVNGRRLHFQLKSAAAPVEKLPPPRGPRPTAPEQRSAGVSWSVERLALRQPPHTPARRVCLPSKALPCCALSALRRRVIPKPDVPRPGVHGKNYPLKSKDRWMTSRVLMGLYAQPHPSNPHLSLNFKR